MLLLAQLTVSTQNRFFPAMQQLFVSFLLIPSSPSSFRRAEVSRLFIILVAFFWSTFGHVSKCRSQTSNTVFQMGCSHMLNLLEANLLCKQDLAAPVAARPHGLSLFPAEASALHLQNCCTATRCLAYISGAGYFCLSSEPEICLQGLYKHFPGYVTGPRGRILSSQVAGFPKPQKFGNCFLKHAHQKCW